MRLAAALVVLCAALFALSLVTGLAAAPAGQSLKALAIDDGTPLSLVMREIRLPRALLAVMVGASLGLSGAALQGYLRNPLAEPGLIGTSASAAQVISSNTRWRSNLRIRAMRFSATSR